MRQIRVVIADDNERVRQVLAELLADEDSMEVVGTAQDADAAIELCSEQRADVALVDVNMPGGGGRRVSREVTQKDPPTQVIGLTADPDPAVHRAMLEAGAVDCFVKFADPKEIVQAIGNVPQG
jgi:DNA-binding NarL/FixJ family response regulator